MLVLLLTPSLSSASKAGLVCYQRVANETVPGCAGDGEPGLDYCCDRPADYLLYVARNVDAGALSACEGDYDGDVDCGGDLICHDRAGFGEVPGCNGSGRRHSDYCYIPDPTPPSLGPTSSSSPTAELAEFETDVEPSATGTGANPHSLGRCKGDCQSNLDCKVCLFRESAPHLRMDSS